MKWLLLFLLLALIVVGGFMAIDAGHGDSNNIRDPMTCAWGVQSAGGTVLDAVRACNPIAP